MAMGSMGGGAGGHMGFSSAERLFEIVMNPEKYKAQVKELKALTEAAQNAVGGKRKIEEADQYLSQAAQKKTEADALLQRAKAKASEILDDANQRAEDLMRSTGTTADKLKEDKANFEKDARQRADALKKKELSLTARENGLNAREAAADRAKDAAKQAEERFKAKLKAIEQAAAA